MHEMFGIWFSLFNRLLQSNDWSFFIPKIGKAARTSRSPLQPVSTTQLQLDLFQTHGFLSSSTFFQTVSKCRDASKLGYSVLQYLMQLTSAHKLHGHSQLLLWQVLYSSVHRFKGLRCRLHVKWCKSVDTEPWTSLILTNLAGSVVRAPKVELCNYSFSSQSNYRFYYELLKSQAPCVSLRTSSLADAWDRIWSI